MEYGKISAASQTCPFHAANLPLPHRKLASSTMQTGILRTSNLPLPHRRLRPCAEKIQNIIDICKNISGISENINGICRNINDILSFLRAKTDFLLCRRRVSGAAGLGRVGGVGGFRVRRAWDRGEGWRDVRWHFVTPMLQLTNKLCAETALREFFLKKN